MNGLDGIREVPESAGAGVHVAGRTFSITPGHTSVGSGETPIIWLASIIVHDACHVHRYEAGLVSGELEGERACLVDQIEALELINPGDLAQFGLYVLLANIENPEYWWWAD